MQVIEYLFFLPSTAGISFMSRQLLAKVTILHGSDISALLDSIL